MGSETRGSAHLEEEALFANGIRAKHEQRRRRGAHAAAAQADDRGNDVVLQRKAVLRRAVCRVQMQNGLAAQLRKRWLRGKLPVVVAAVPGMQDRGVARGVKEEHNSAGAVVCGDCGDAAAAHDERPVPRNLL